MKPLIFLNQQNWITQSHVLILGLCGMLKWTAYTDPLQIIEPYSKQGIEGIILFLFDYFSGFNYINFVVNHVLCSVTFYREELSKRVAKTSHNSVGNHKKIV